MKIAFTPLVIKNTESINATDNNPPLGVLAISSKIVPKKSEVSGGNRESIKTRNSIWKSSMKVMYGIKFSTNSRNGKIAIKKLNAMLLARVEKVPFTIPPQ